MTSHSFNNASSATPSSSRFMTPSLIDMARCDCYGRLRTCTKCASRRKQVAARAGTPGFRPPEVLLKVEYQTTAVDIWAAGVILLSLMTRTYPFFRSPDDMTSLAEICCIFGTDKMKQVTHNAVLSHKMPKSGFLRFRSLDIMASFLFAPIIGRANRSKS